MAFGFRYWNARDLLATWSLYWIGLAAVAARPLWRAYEFASHAPKGHSSVSLGIGDGQFNLVGLLDGQRVLGGSIGITTVVLLIAGPPLALWALWLLRRPRRGGAAVGAIDAAPLLPAQRWDASPEQQLARREQLGERHES